MDYNPIKQKVNIISASMKTRYELDILDKINIEIKHVSNYKSILVTFGKKNEIEIIRIIGDILHNIATIRDLMKNKMERTGQNKRLIENEINKCFHLQILIDIDNQLKHGYPLTINPRTKKNPIMKNFRQSMSVSSGTSPGARSFFCISLDGKVETKGDVSIIVNCDIFDDKGNNLFTLDEMINNSIEKIMGIIGKYALDE